MGTSIRGWISGRKGESGGDNKDMTRITATEHQEQAALIEWCRLHQSQYPDLRYLYAIPNGGHRRKAVAAKLRAEGVRAGCPDLCLPCPRGLFHGLYIEMKARKGRTSAAQLEFLQGLRERGYCTAVCFGWEVARTTIENYLMLKGNKNE